VYKGADSARNRAGKNIPQTDGLNCAAMQTDSTQHRSRPVLLCLGGHDPVGGAGIQADIETIAALGGHAATVVTCLTVQDSRNVRRLEAVSSAMLREQAEAVLGDMAVAAVKIGLIGSAALVPVIAELLRRHPDLPVVLDPVLAAGGGTELAGADLLAAIREQLLPRTTLITPNLAEAQRLTGATEPDACADALLAAGCQAVLLTGADSAGDAPEVLNRLYRPGQRTEHWHWPRLPHSYHGSGCTLAAACACLLAQGLALTEAAAQAQAFTDAALRAGWRPGHGQHLPWRRSP
jgi:hydroxymethylpyrimidine/phosphomethylpyrimidine kinase